MISTPMNPEHLFGFPDMGRTGLGHSLLAWGRCAVWCRDTGATMLAPQWFRIRVGPYLRREHDKRNYFKLFTRGECVGEPRKSLILAGAVRLYSELDLPEPGCNPSRNTVVVFRNAESVNERKFFHLVVGEGPYLSEQFRKMVRPAYLPELPPEPFIAVHSWSSQTEKTMPCRQFSLFQTARAHPSRNQ